MLLLAALLMDSPASATTVSGTFKRPDGTPINGTIEFVLSQQAKTTTPPVTYAPVRTTCPVTNGAISPGCTVQGNDTLDPAGTFYRVRVLDLNNLVVIPQANYTLAGAAVDLSQLPVTATDTLVPPTGSVTGNLNVTGNLTVGGTATFGADPQDFAHLRLVGLTSDPLNSGPGSVFHRSDLDTVRFHVSGLEVFDGTQYLPLAASSQETLDLNASLRIPDKFAVTVKRLNHIRFVDPELWTEPDVTSKINAAVADCLGAPCTVVLPSNLGAGSPTSLPATASLVDLRSAPEWQRHNRVLNANLFVGADIGAKVNAALAEIYSTGGVVMVPAGAYTYSTPIVITRTSIGDDKRLVLDLNGAVLTFTSNTSGDAAIKVDGTGAVSTRDNLVLQNGTILYGGTGTGMFGLNFTVSGNRPVVRNLELRGFSTTGSIALMLTNTQNGSFENLYFRNNQTAVMLDAASNNNTLSGLKIDQDNVSPVVIQNSSGNTFIGALIQSNSGVYTVQFNATNTEGISDTSFINCWFENNGDGTANHRLFRFNPDATRIVFNTSIYGGMLIPGTQGQNGKIWATQGTGFVDTLTVTGTRIVGPWAGSYEMLSTDAGWSFINVRGLSTTGNTGTPFIRTFPNTHNWKFGSQDAATLVDLDSGRTAAQNADINFYDRGTLLYTLRKSAGNGFFILDSNSIGRYNVAVNSTSVYRSGTTTTHHSFRNSADTVRVQIHGDADRISFGSALDTSIERSAADELSTGSNDRFRFTTGINNNGGGFKHARVSTGSIPAGSSAGVTVTWATAFADANYTANCSVVEATAGTASLRVHHIESVSAGSIVVRVVNDDGAAAKTGTLHCTAVHD